MLVALPPTEKLTEAIDFIGSSSTSIRKLPLKLPQFLRMTLNTVVVFIELRFNDSEKPA
jgi:hypothetical protein